MSNIPYKSCFPQVRQEGGAMPTLEHKQQILKAMETKELIESLNAKNQQLFENQLIEASYVKENREYIPTRGCDCRAVQLREAELKAEAPDEIDGKKTTAPKLEAWLVRQRKDDSQLVSFIQKQADVEFTIEDMRLKNGYLQRQTNAMLGLLSLRTAQITFLAGSTEEII